MSINHYRAKKLKLLAKYGNVCYLCDKELPEEELDLEHMLPRARGGTNCIDNLQLACTPCNNEKGFMTVTEYQEFKALPKDERKAYVKGLGLRFGFKYGIKSSRASKSTVGKPTTKHLMYGLASRWPTVEVWEPDEYDYKDKFPNEAS